MSFSEYWSTNFVHVAMVIVYLLRFIHSMQSQ